MSWYVAECLDVLLAEINASAPGRSKVSDGSIGDQAHQNSDSDHNPCDCHNAVCARDFTHDPDGGFDSYEFAEWLRQRCDDNLERRVKYIVSNRRIASDTHQDWDWRPYSGSNPHDHHVHVSVEHGPDVYNDPCAWGWGILPKPTPPPNVGDKEMAAPAQVIDNNGDGWVFFRGLDNALWFQRGWEGAHSLGGIVTDAISAAHVNGIINIYAYAPDGNTYFWQFRDGNISVDKALVAP